ncbi:hypothetical protein HHI36_010058 [Cryptolaemus montrouzieri]|uniref:Uncharacterized protein n=1 Tax=Cryptolaemus montrouzieri TaxID=559131 RepID=A0ABD2MHR8_9CUCU
MISREKTIGKILNKDSDSESEAGGIPEERSSDREIIIGCEDPVTLELNDNEDMDSDVQVSSTKSEDKNVSGPSQFSYYEKIYTNGPPAPTRTRQHNIVRQRP